MTVLFMEGFDWTGDQNDLPDGRWDYGTPAYAPSTTYGRFGTKGVYIYQYQSNDTMEKQLTFDTYQTVAIGVALRVASLPTYNSSYPFLRFKDKNNTTQVRFHGNGHDIQIRDGAGTLLDTITDVINNDVWFYFEAKVTVSDAAGVIEVRIDGEEKSNLTSQDTKFGTDYIDKVRFASLYVAGTSFDDIYITDGNFIGPCHVKTMFVEADGAHADLIPLTGSDHYAMVDETNPDDDTSYLTGIVNGQKDSFTVTPPAGASKIIAVQISNRVKKTGTTIAKVKNLVRSGGADYTYNETFLGSTYRHLQTVLETDPQDSQEWTKAKIAAAEFGIEITAVTSTTTTTTTTTTT